MRVLWNMCIASNKKECNSAVHRQTGLRINKRFAKGYFVDKDASPDRDA